MASCERYAYAWILVSNTLCEHIFADITLIGLLGYSRHFGRIGDAYAVGLSSCFLVDIVVTVVTALNRGVK